MYTVNVQNPIILDVAELITDPAKATELTVSQSETQNKESGIVWIKNLDSMTDELIDNLCEKLNTIICSNKQTVYLAEEEDAVALSRAYGLELPKNLWLGSYSFTSKEKTTVTENWTPRWVMVSADVVGLNFEALRNYSWIIIQRNKSEVENDVLIRIGEIIRYCNQNNINVSTDPNTNLKKIEAAYAENYSISDVKLRYELPTASDYTLMVLDKRAPVVLDEVKSGLVYWTQMSVVSTLGVAYGIYKLHDMARQMGERSFWRTYFNVETFEEFALQVNKISRSTALRYIQTVKTSEKLRPGYLQNIFEANDPTTVNALGYARFLDVSPYSKSIQASPIEQQETVCDKLYNENVKRPELKRYLRESFPDIVIETKLKPFNPTQYLQDVSKKLLANLGEGRREYVNLYLGAVSSLFDKTTENFPALASQVDIKDAPMLFVEEEENPV